MRDIVFIALVCTLWSFLPPQISGSESSLPESCSRANEDESGIVCLVDSISANGFNFNRVHANATSDLRVFCKNNVQESKINSGALSHLTSLRSLQIEKCRFSELSADAFQGLEELRHLTISTSRNIPLSNETLNHLKNLEELYLRYNNITDLPKQILCPLTKLKFLDISHNEINQFDGDDYSHCLHQPYILDLSYNKITEIVYESVPKNAKMLNLQYNNISVLEAAAFADTPNLELVDLRNNRLVHLNLNAFFLNINGSHENKSMPDFYISNNPYECTCNMAWMQSANSIKWSRQYPHFVDLDLVICKLPVHLGFIEMPMMEALPNHFLCNYRKHCFSLCFCCEFDVCHCEAKCPDNCTCFNDATWNTNIVDCAAQGFTSVPADIPMDVTELYLDGNNITSLNKSMLLGRKNLQFINLNNSNVQHIEEGSFNGLKSLLVLRLDGNKLTTLTGQEFQPLENLRELHLQDNDISEINNETFANLKLLQVLNLDNNPGNFGNATLINLKANEVNTQ